MAEALGLSTSTVSLALRDSPLIAEATKARVKAHAEEAGYIYNRSAASLRTAKSDLIGVAVHDIMNPYFAEVFSGLEEELVASGKTVLICNHRDLVGRQRQFVDSLLQHRVDGLIICAAVGTKAEEINRIHRQGVPVTLVCRDVPGAQVPCVRGDDYSGAYDVTSHLIRQGHRHIAMIGGRQASSAGRDRYLGWRTAMEDAGLNLDEQMVVPELMSRSEGQQVVPELLAFEPRPTAVMCFNDLLAMSIMTAVRRLGVEPGVGLAICGYDDTEGAANRTPALTTVSNGAVQIGEQAALQMLRALKGQQVPPAITLISPQVRLRESTPPPKR
ncbi:LacI family DNA-binding transcriptional regulator [Polycladidibacter hongkongensis]|uniref:LacI family DNA-binding transcriptional regulator n=1 Tax=Polycladidibacter hongkongensis TaxID=1647556 RepID=UPI00155E67EE|nr:LacI family DNA-binding transcriptional regulator [Pseudovibrio hongkongensis]